MDLSDHEVLAFRRLVYKFSLKLSKEERRALVYIRLYDCKERYRDADTLEVLSRLETDCVFSPHNPQGLINVAKDICRMDLKDMVKDFVKRKQRREKASSKTTEKIVTSFKSESPVSDEQLHLKAILEVTLSQAAVFVQQVDILQQAIVAGTKEQRQKAAEAIRDAGRTAQALSERLKEAQGELEQHCSHNSSQSDSSGSKENDYYNLKYGPPTSADTTLLVAMETTSISDEIPILTPRQVLVPLQESQHKPTSTEKVCYQNQTLAGSLNVADLSHVRQQGTPPVDHQGIIFPNARRWTAAAESSGSKSAQSSPFQSRHSLQPKQLSKPVDLPKKRKPTSSDASTPKTSTKKQPTSSDASTPETSTKKQPTSSDASTPETSTKKQPTSSDASTPETSTKKQPISSDASTPKTSTKKQPTSSDASTPKTSTEKQPTANLEDYSILSPITDEGDESIITSDSGFEETRQWKRQEVSPKDGDYTDLQY